MIKKLPLRKKYAVLLTCIALALFAWFVVKMSVNYIATYQLEVVFTNIPENRNLMLQSDTIIIITFEDKGLTLLPLELSSKKLKIDYQQITSSYQKKYNNICLEKQQLKNYIKSQHKFSGTIKSITPERICLHIENR
jgi:hypothetical protein